MKNLVIRGRSKSHWFKRDFKDLNDAIVFAYQLDQPSYISVYGKLLGTGTGNDSDTPGKIGHVSLFGFATPNSYRTMGFYNTLIEENERSATDWITKTGKPRTRTYTVWTRGKKIGSEYTSKVSDYIRELPNEKES